MDDVFEFGKGQLGIGCVLDDKMKEKYPKIYYDRKIGDVIIFYEIVAVYDLQQIYFNGEGVYPTIRLE